MGKRAVTRAEERAVAAAFRRDPRTRLAELAREYGMHRATVRRILEDEGLWTRGGPGPRKGPRGLEAELCDRYRRGEHIPELAAEKGMTPPEVHAILVKGGVQLR